MPPFNYPSFEEIEAKEWAFNTVETILKNVGPVSFEKPDNQNIKAEILSQSKSLNDKTSNNQNNQNKINLKRSLSYFDNNLFTLQSKQEIKDSIRGTRRSQSTIVPNTSYQSIDNINLFRLPQHSSRSRSTWQLDRSKLIRSTFDLFNINISNDRKRSNKEQKGVTIWKNKFMEYSIQPPWSKEFKTKSSTKSSTQLAKFIMNELLTTEETYVNHLLTIKNFYMDPLIEAAGDDKKTLLVNLKNIETIFAYIPELIILSTTLAKHLHSTISQYLTDDSKSNEVSIGKIFCDFEPYFEVYIAYAVNYPKSRKYLNKSSSNITYRQLIQDTIRKKDTNRMILSDYMIAPIQRITRYCLLLTDLLKHLNKFHPDYMYLDRTLKSLSALAYAMDTLQ